MQESAAAAGFTAKSALENYYRWVEPDSDITVCLNLDTVDRLQHEVLRGIDSFSYSGNEVGGILLGRTESGEGRILTFVDDFRPVVCEHRNGPPYALTGQDSVDFEAALARGGSRQAPSVVGYYRSHNREGLFLSADDLRIVHRHFRKPDNVFLLIKTLPNRACLAGFFFWKDGQIQSEFTNSEAPLIPVSVPSAGRSLSLVEAAAEIPAAPPAPVPSVDKASVVKASVVKEYPAITAPELGRTRHLNSRLIGGTMAACIGAALVFGIVRYRETGSAQDQTPNALQPVPVTAGLNPPPTPLPAPSPIVQSAPLVPSQPKAVFPQTRSQDTTPLRDEQKLPDSTPTPEPAAVPTPAVREAIREPGASPSPEPLAATTERPLSAAPAGFAGTVIPPPVVSPPQALEKPVAPALEALRKEAVAHVVPLVPIPSHPTPPVSPAHTFVGPQIAHQATPAVPRGVWPKIKTNVQIDVAVTIDADGKVTGAQIASSQGAAAEFLIANALKAAHLCRFQPAQEDGRSVASSMVLTFRFAPAK